MVNFSNHLTALAAEIQTLHAASEAALHTSIEKATAAGRLLIEAKAEVVHGQWLPWLKSVGISTRTAQQYMQLARVPADKYETVSHLGIKAALAEIGHRRSKLMDLLHALEDKLDEYTALRKPKDGHSDLQSLERGIDYHVNCLKLLGGYHTVDPDPDFADWPPGYIDILVAYIREKHQWMRDAFGIPDREMRDWYGRNERLRKEHGVFGGPEPAVFQRMHNNELTKQDRKLLDKIDLDEIQELSALEDEVYAKFDALGARE
jgi:hypothetical protein